MDDLGRDILARVIYGSQVSLEVAFISTGVAVLIGVAIGTAAGYFRGWVDSLLARRAADKSFKPLPAFPAIRRDVAMLVPEATTHAAVLQAVKQARPRNLESVELFDVFRGKNVPAGQKSVAYAFIYRNPGQTLTDAEVNAAHQQLVEQLKQHLQAVIRE